MSKKYLVTGVAGFIGSHLADKLLKQGHYVIGIDDFSSGVQSNLRNAKDYARFTFIEGDVCDLEDLGGLDGIFHLAAMARIQPSFDDPKGTLANNINATTAACELARKNNCSIVYAGSSTFYYDVHVNPYAFSKWTGEQICEMYNKVFDVPASFARFFNVYGPRQIETGKYATVIGIFEYQKRTNRALTVTGDGLKRRDFTHVHDIVDGLIAIDEYLKDGGKFNSFPLGTGTNYSIKEVAEAFDPKEIQHIPSRS